MVKQLSFFDEFTEDSPSTVLDLLNLHFDIQHLLPATWIYRFYKRLGRNHDYSLSSYVSALLIQKLFSIPMDSLLLLLLNVSAELRDFCGLGDKVFEKTMLSRFKSTFADDIENFFHTMVDLTEPICHKLDKDAAKALIIDTTGIEIYVKENNPKFFNSIVKRLEAYYKSRGVDFSQTDIYKAAWAQMPKHSQSNPEASLQYVNGHFTYALKGALMCNASGIIRHMEFCDSFSDPSAVSQDPEESKYLSDQKIFKPALDNFFEKHPSFAYDYIVGDSGFDSSSNNNHAYYEHGLIPLISINPRHSDSSRPEPGIANGMLTCPKDSTLPLLFDCEIHGKNRTPRLKYMCPKCRRTSNGYVCSCEDPCTDCKCGYIHYEKPSDDIRSHPIIPRDSEQWDNIAGKRHVIEQVISRLKLPLWMGGSYTRDTRTAKADFFMSGVAHLVIVYVAYKAGLLDKVRCVKSIAA
jgi:hypothetical protein